MSDWRGDDSSRKKEKPKRKSMPVIPRRDGPIQAKGEPRSWTGKPVESSEKPTEPQRSWVGQAPPDTPTSRMSLRKIALWLLTPALAIATTLFIYYITKGKDNEIPLLLLVGKDRQPSEFGELGFPDSQALSTSVTRVLNPTGKVFTDIRDNDSNWLKNLKDEAGLKDYLKADSNGVLLQGGGKGNQFVAFYLRCFVVRKGEQWLLVTGSDESTFPLACDSENQPTKSLLIQDALKRLAQATPSNCLAIVGLDVRTPYSICNLGDIGFPHKAFRDAFEGLEQADKNKLVLFLPCGPGEENWSVPKTGVTIFGTTFLNGLTVMFEKEDRSLEGFANRVQANVSGWVSQNRKSHQEPTLVYDEGTWKKIKNKPFLGFFTDNPTDKAEGKPASDSPKPESLLSFYKELDALWRGYESIARDRLDPEQHLILASLEAHLLLLEDNVEYQPAAWDSMVASAEENLKLLQSPNRLYRVSDIEDGSEYKLRSSLKEEIDPITLANEEKKRLAEETLDLLLDRWSEIERLASHPRRELSWWMADRIKELDEQFLKAVDEFTANNFEEARAILENDKLSVTKAKDDLKRLADCMSFRDQASSFVPHAMAFLVRTNRYSETEQEKQSDAMEAERLADIAAALGRIEDLLRTSRIDKVGQDAEDPQKKLREAKDSILGKIQGWLTKEKKDPETIRNLRIAVRYPFLPIKEREEAHQRLASRFEEEGESGRSDSSPVRRNDERQTEKTDDSKDDLATIFLTRLPSDVSADVREYWETILRSDLRNSEKFWTVDSSTAPKNYQELYANTYRVRRMMGALGMHSVSQPDRLLSTCAGKILDSYSAINELRYRHLQRERLLLARWGSPDVDISRIEGAFRFEEMAKKYTDGSLQLKNRILPDWHFEGEKEKNLDNLFQSISARLKQMSGYLRAELDAASKIRFKWQIPETGNSDQKQWDIIQPAIKIAYNTDPKSTIGFSLLKETDVRLFPTEKDLNSGDMDVTVSFRGHRIIHPIGSNLIFQSNWVRSKEASLTATLGSFDRYVVILLDCSGSMSENIRMKQAVEAVEELIYRLRELEGTGIKIHVSLMVFGIAEPHDKNSSFIDPKTTLFQVARIGDRVLSMQTPPKAGVEVEYFSHVAHTEFLNSEDPKLLEALRLKDIVKPTSETPLYDAIACAYDLLKSKSSSNIFIFSDGENRVITGDSNDPWRMNVKEWENDKQNGKPLYYPNSITRGEIKKTLRQDRNVDFYFYQVRDGDSSQEKSEKENFIADLKEVKQESKAKIVAEPYRTFEAVKNQLREVFPSYEIRVDPLDGTQKSSLAFTYPLPVNQQPIPPGRNRLSIVESSGGQSRKDSSVPSQDVDVYGGQHLQIELDREKGAILFKSPAELKENNLLFSLSPSSTLPSDNPGSDYTLKWDFRRNEFRENAFLVRVGVRRERDRKPPEYLPWPRFALGKLNRNLPNDAPDAKRPTILFSDLDFERRHYPTLEFRVDSVKDIAWEKSGGALDLWWSFSDAHKLFGSRDDIRKDVQIDSQIVPFRGWEIERSSASIRVEREHRLGEEKYQWVLCPDAEKASRQYRERTDRSDRWTEIHTFTLPEEKVSENVSLYFLSENELEQFSQDPVSEDQRIYWFNGKK